MNDEGLDSSGVDDEGGGGGSLVAASFGVLGIILGGIGLYVGFNAKQELASYQDKVAVDVDKIPALENQAEVYQGKLQALQAELAAVRGKAEEFDRTTRAAFTALGTRVQSNQNEISRTNGQLRLLGERLAEVERPAEAELVPLASHEVPPVASARAGAEAGSPDGADPGGGEVAGGAAGGFHIIAKNENFSVVAKLYGVTVAELIEANPSVEPKKLQIGQRIKLP